MAQLLKEWKVPCLIHQPSYSLLNRWVETEGLVQMALAWVLRAPRVSSTLIGASSSAHIHENAGALRKLAQFVQQKLTPPTGVRSGKWTNMNYFSPILSSQNGRHQLEDKVQKWQFAGPDPGLRHATHA